MVDFAVTPLQDGMTAVKIMQQKNESLQYPFGRLFGASNSPLGHGF